MKLIPDIALSPKHTSVVRVALSKDKAPWFFEIAEALLDALLENDISASLVVRTTKDLQHMWLKGWSLYTWIVMTPELFEKLPKNCIAYNFEQLDARHSHTNPAVLECFVSICKQAQEVWDFSHRNTAFWVSRGVLPKVVPLGYTARMTYPLATAKTEHKCLFMGNVYGRRVEYVRLLTEALGDRFEVVSDCFCYGDARDSPNFVDDRKIRALARAAVVVNLKPVEPSLTCLETSRVAWCVANRVLVVSERDDDVKAREMYESVGVVFADSPSAVYQAVVAFLSETPERRLQRAEANLEAFRSMGYAKQLKTQTERIELSV